MNNTDAPIVAQTPASVNTPDELARALALLRRVSPAAGKAADDALAREFAREPGADSWHAYSLADAYADRPPVRYVVAGLLQLPSLSVAYGAPGTLKSMLLSDLAVCVAAGRPWLPPLPGEKCAPRQTIGAPVAWLDFDNGARRCHERFAALAKARDLPPTIPLAYYSMPAPWLVASEPDSMADLQERIVRIGAALVVIDNLGVVAGVDENSPEIGGVMSRFRRLAEETGAAVVLVHHQRKSNGFVGRAGETLRGHSSIEAALDLALLIEREESAGMVTVRATKSRDVVVSSFGAQFAYNAKPNGELDVAQFYGLPVEDTTSDGAVKAMILAAVDAKHPMKRAELVAAVQSCCEDDRKPGRTRIWSLADGLVKSGELVGTSGAKGAVLYDVR